MLSKETVREIRAMAKQGYKPKEIAHHFEIERRLRITPLTICVKTRDIRKTTKEKILNMDCAKMTPTEIAEKVRCSYAYAASIVKKYKLKAIVTKGGRRKKGEKITSKKA